MVNIHARLVVGTDEYQISVEADAPVAAAEKMLAARETILEGLKRKEEE